MRLYPLITKPAQSSGMPCAGDALSKEDSQQGAAGGQAQTDDGHDKPGFGDAAPGLLLSLDAQNQAGDGDGVSHQGQDPRHETEDAQHHACYRLAVAFRQYGLLPGIVHARGRCLLHGRNLTHGRRQRGLPEWSLFIYAGHSLPLRHSAVGAKSQPGRDLLSAAGTVLHGRHLLHGSTAAVAKGCTGFIVCAAVSTKHIKSFPGSAEACRCGVMIISLLQKRQIVKPTGFDFFPKK